MKMYFINLWYAIKGSKQPSGLPADTWFRLYESGKPYGFILTDSTGNIRPFTKTGKVFSWKIPEKSEMKIEVPDSTLIVTNGWQDDLNINRGNE